MGQVNAMQVEFSIRKIDNKTEAIDVHVLGGGHGGHGGHGPGIPAHKGSAGLWAVVHAEFTRSYPRCSMYGI